MQNYPPLIAVLGPTAVGKTAISFQLASDFDGEIVSADSRQIYRGLDIGTDKIEALRRDSVPHHLLDVVEPDAFFTLAQYQRAAFNAIDDIHQRGGIAFLVGGTGLYVRAVLEGLGIPEAPPNETIRGELYDFWETQGAQALHKRLQGLDPDAAAKIDPRNVRRVIRALEVCLVTGDTMTELQKATPPPYRILRIGLSRSRETLYARIDHRVDAMIDRGLVAEVQGLLDAGYSLDLPSMTGLGYRQIGAYLQGESTLEEAVAAIKKQTRRFVRQQGTWFRAGDERIRWFDLEETGYEEIREAVATWLKNG